MSEIPPEAVGCRLTPAQRAQDRADMIRNILIASGPVRPPTRAVAKAPEGPAEAVGAVAEAVRTVAKAPKGPAEAVRTVATEAPAKKASKGPAEAVAKAPVKSQGVPKQPAIAPPKHLVQPPAEPASKAMPRSKPY